MKTILLLLACMSPLVAAALPEGTKITPDATPETPGVLSWTVTSPYQEGPNKLEVLLPQPLKPGRKYPVVYCLPVNATTKGDWGHPLTEAIKLDLPNRHQAIFVTPAYAVLPWFGDNPQRPEMRQNQYLIDVVIPFIESQYPADATPRGRYLVGFSKSGHGALGLFLRQPDFFSKVAVFENWWGVPNDEQWTQWGFATCYGTRENFDAYDPQLLIDKRKEQLAAGPTRIAVLLGGPGARLGVEGLLGKLRDRRIPHTEIRNAAMAHTWTSGWLPLAVAAIDPGGQ